MRRWITLLALGLVSGLAGCDSIVLGPGSLSVRLDEPFTLRVDEAASLAGGDLWLRFRDVSTDTRCPVDVWCSWPGDAEVVLSISRAGRERFRTLHTTAGLQTGPRSTDVEGYRITLLALEPLPRRGMRLRLSDYRATLRINRF